MADEAKNGKDEKTQTPQGGLIVDTQTGRVNFNVFEEDITGIDANGKKTCEGMAGAFLKTVGIKPVNGKITTVQVRQLVKNPVCPGCGKKVWEMATHVSAGGKTDERKDEEKATMKKIRNMTDDDLAKVMKNLGVEVEVEDED